ncbi:MAG: UDP-N-acetylmuramate--L-alanine ligase [Candidatus Omnitrophota bacterium]
MQSALYNNKSDISDNVLLLGKKIHFIGIGGIGMSGIASILVEQGYIVSGSDLKDSPVTRKLSEKGVKVFIGHSRLHIEDKDAVVYSSAVKEDNPELLAARKNGLPVLRRAQMLAKLMRDKICVAVSGAHGKTTTTALASHLLREAGLCPTAAIGGIARDLGDNCCFGRESRFFVAEADESDGTFLYYNPEYPIITNIDREHLDYYQSWNDIIAAYKEFISHSKDEGCLFCCGDDPTLRGITRDYGKRIVYFGLSPENDFYPEDIILNEFSSLFNCCYRGKTLGEITLPLAGRHNISNCLSVIALGHELHIPQKIIQSALASFHGTERRFQLKGDFFGIKIIDDYGHHPSEIKAVLAAAGNVKHQRLIVVFQPHRYSRTKFLFEEFVASFAGADQLILTDIYAASEKPIEGVSAESLCAGIKEKSSGIEAVYLKKENITEHLLKSIKAGDLIITLGAGDIGKLSDELVWRIKSEGISQRIPG